MARRMKLKMRGGGGGGSSGGATTSSSFDSPTKFYITNNMIFFGLAAIIIGLLIYVIATNNTPGSAIRGVVSTQPNPPTILNIGGGGEHRGITSVLSTGYAGGDSRYDRAPQPLRDWNAGPEFPPRGGIASIPINIPTQGLPERFQSVGIMTTPDGQVLPLYGRRTATATDRWNYYTRTDTYNPVPIPVSYKKRDCMDDIGCEELMDGEDVKNFGTGAESKVHIYRMDGPKYIPGII
jgi:hypothetical protein